MIWDLVIVTVELIELYPFAYGFGDIDSCRTAFEMLRDAGEIPADATVECRSR